MWMRGIIGIGLVLIGGLWFLQGVGVAKGSFMTGHGQWTVIGGVAVVLGVALIVWAVFVGRRERQES
jgi:hypothetical protein